MTETAGPQESDDSLPTAAAGSMPQQRGPSSGNVPGGQPGTTPGHPSPAGARPDQDRETMPPPAPRPLQRRNTDPFDNAELRALYGIHATAPSSGLLAALREHLQDVNPNRLFAVVPLPHAATTDIFVRQLQALVTPDTKITDDLVDAWIWRFNIHQPSQGGIWVPHLGWAHTLIAPPTDPRPAPSTEGREQAAPPPRAETLNIPPYKDLAEWESRTARDRGRNLKSMGERYLETARAAPPLREADPSTIALIVFKNGHYYQVRITLHPQERHWSLEAVDSMLPANAAPPDSPTPLPNDQPLDPSMAIVSGAAGTWHPGHVLYCLWRWAQCRWSHTRDFTATWRFHLDGWQQLEAIPQRERTAETRTATNLCPVFAIQQIRALAMGGQLQPTICTETEPQAAHAALVHKIFSALCSALVRHVGNPPGPLTTASRKREHTPMNTRGDTIETATPSLTRHRQCKEDTPPRTRGTNPTLATRR